MNYRRFLIGTALLIGAMLLASAYAWWQLPAGDRIATHWNAAGVADGFMSKGPALLALPILATVVALVLAALPRFDSRRRSLEQSSGAYVTVCLAVLGVLAVVHFGLVAQALNKSFDELRLAALGVAGFTMVMGNVLGKLRRNSTVGIRTPWTMASDWTWDRTHRMTGRVIVVVGLAALVVAIVAPTPIAFAVVVGGLVLALVWSFVYSFVVWRRDPARSGPRTAVQ